MSKRRRLVVVEVCQARVLGNNADTLDDLDAVLGEDLDLLRVVGHRPHALDAEVPKDDHSGPEVSQITLDRIHVPVEGLKLLEVAVGLAFVVEVVDDQTDAVVRLKHPQSLFELPVAVAELIVEDVAGEAGAVDPDERHSVRGQVGDVTLVQDGVLFDATSSPRFEAALHDVGQVRTIQRHVEDATDDLREPEDLDLVAEPLEGSGATLRSRSDR